MDAAEAVVAGSGVGPDEAMDAMSSLVDKSLVAIEVESGRYRMLDTVRHYAQEKLAESGEARATTLAHCRYFLSLAERARGAARGEERARAFGQLDVERDNLLSAAAIEASPEADPLALRLADALRYYLINRGLPSAALRNSRTLLDRPSLAGRTVERCKTLFAAGQVAYFMGRYPDAVSHLTESLEIARELGDEFWMAAALQPLGMACIGNGELDKAAGYLDEALARAERLGVKHELLAALNARGMLHRLAAETDSAARLYTRALEISRELADFESAALVLLNLAIVEIERGSTPGGRALLLQALNDARTAGSRPALQAVLDVAAGLAAAEQHWRRAARLYGAAQAEAAHTGLQRDPADEAFLMPRIEAARAALGGAFAPALDEGAQLEVEQALADVSAWFSGVCESAATAR